MKYGLRKINKNGIHFKFQWPLEVGAVATAPDWNPEPDCGGGLHFFDVESNADFYVLYGDYWAVIEYDETKAVAIRGGEKHKVESCKIVHLSESVDGLLDFFKNYKFTPRSAYGWALSIGDREHMKQFVTEPEWAYCWALNIGDREYMKQFVTESEWAYKWALDIGDKEHMKQFVIGSEWAHKYL